MDAGTDPVHVRQLEPIEVREAQVPADALERERERDALPTDSPTMPTVAPREPRLLGRRDLVAVAVEPQLANSAGPRTWTSRRDHG